MTDLQRSHAELRAAVILAGKEIRKLTVGRADKVCSNPFPPVMSTRNPPLNGSAAIHPSYGALVCGELSSVDRPIVTSPIK
jgi:hypothetical protein